MEAAAVLDEVELAILAVPDDAIASVVEPLRLYSGQALVHTSGLLGAEVLESALAAGSQVGAFHPLVSFTSDVERSIAAIKGSTIALEGDDRLMGLLADLAEAIGGVPVRLPRGSKAAYHAAAVLASGGLVALLDAITRLGAAAGLDERGSLAVYGRLVEQTLANARAIGVAASLTGPITQRRRWHAGSPSGGAQGSRPGCDGPLRGSRPARAGDRRGASRSVTGAAGAYPGARLQRRADRVRLAPCSTASRRSMRPGPLPASSVRPAARGSGGSGFTPACRFQRAATQPDRSCAPHMVACWQPAGFP